MTRHRADWLDRLALRSVAQPSQDAQELEAHSETGERFSRTAAVKLAVAGGAALAFGLGVAPGARAQDRGKCFADCLDTHEKELKRRLQSCEDVFEPRQHYVGDWRYWARLVPGAARDYSLVGYTLTGLCYGKAKWEVGGDKTECYKGCEQTCRKRSMQSSSGRSAATCEVTPPQHAPPPTVPPIPSPTTGVTAECANCAQVGGECCSGDDPTHLCGCASYDPDGPMTACQRVGCR